MSESVCHKNICTSRVKTPLGEIILAAADDQLIGLWFSGQKHEPTKTAAWITHNQHPLFIKVADSIDLYFRGHRLSIDFPLSPAGTDFQKAVWQILRNIPYGETRTYANIAHFTARLLGRQSMSARAVGQAIGRNPISILIPCHRVVGADGRITGYAGGVERKAALLRLEKEHRDA